MVLESDAGDVLFGTLLVGVVLDEDDHVVGVVKDRDGLLSGQIDGILDDFLGEFLFHVVDCS